MNDAEILMSVQDIARSTRLSPRQINNYRAAAERRLGVKLGRKEGKVTYFEASEVKAILESRQAENREIPGNSQNFREAVNFSNANNQAEASTLTGMEGLVAAGDQSAIAIGQALAARHQQVLWTAYMQSMQTGMMQICEQFNEMHTAIAIPLSEAPQLPGTSQNFLEGGDA